MPSPPASKNPDDFAGPTLLRPGSGVRVGGNDTLFKAGDRVAANIQLVSVLGVGGMGDVWLANHIGLDTAVAVKFMSSALAHDEALIERFAREAKLSSRIKSPHVVQIFDFATTQEGIPYIVMELIEGETLEARIRRDGKLGLEETSRILVQLCRALTKAHEIGIIHRDLKPENILLGEEEGALFVRILDFGIAKHIDAPKGITDAGATMGTPWYMSPEQLFHIADMDHRSDLWSLGVTTYFCLTGCLPFDGDSFGAVCVAINGGLYTAASKINPGIPKAMDAWMAKALAPSAGERFGSAKEMSDGYIEVLEGAGQLPLWAMRNDTVAGEVPRDGGGARSLPSATVPVRREIGKRSRIAAALVGAVMLIAIGFWSRDVSLGRFVKAHVPARWALGVDGLGAPTAFVPPPAPSRVEPRDVVAPSAAPAVAITPVALRAHARTTPKAESAQSATVQAVPVASVRSAASDRSMGMALAGEPGASDSEGNPYSDSGAPSAALIPAQPPEKPVVDPQPQPDAHAPAL